MKIIISTILLLLLNVLGNSQNPNNKVTASESLVKVNAEPKLGFNFSYNIFIPKGVDEQSINYLLVETNNTGSNDSILHHEKEAELGASKNSLGNSISRKLKMPFLFPAFPRPSTEWRLYTHALDRDSALLNDSEIKRLGANIGGGVSGAGGGVGTYILRDGLLTLKYQDGRVIKKSFFYTEDDGDGTALINGVYYFEPDELNDKTTNSIQNKDKTPIKTPAKSELMSISDGVYVGNLNGFNVTFTHKFYFRTDGTYTTELDKPDWQTRVTGRYKVIGQDITLFPKKPDEVTEKIKIKENGLGIDYGSVALIKHKFMNSLPATILERRGGMTSGGGLTGTTFVSASFIGIYNFDGKGKFSHNSSFSTLAAGNNVGGGTSNESGGDGTYTIKNSLLTLTYKDGTVVKKSLFYYEYDDGFATALIDGLFYIAPDQPQNGKNTAIQKENSELKTPQNKNPLITTLNGAYAGSSVPVFFPGGGSSSTSYRYYFRPNGTYTTELSEPNWQTRIDGNYKITKGKVTLIPNQVGEKPFEMDIEEEGASLVYGGNTLFKLNVMNSIPAVVVENSGGSSSGGMGTNLVFVGVLFSGVYNFDGEGRFSNNASSSSVISGANVGGGSSNESGGFGTYTIKDSLLTLTYNNGKVVKKSFFYIEFSHGGTALIDGSLYYEPDKEEKNQTVAAENPPNENQNINPNVTNNPLPKNSEIAQRGLSILKKANYAHGGVNLDNLETLRLIGKGSGLDIVILVDLKNQRIRQEVRKKGVLLQIEQFDGNDNWQFSDGKKTKLHEIREVEMKKVLKTGLFALQSQSIARINVLTVDVNNQTNLKSLMLLIDGKKHGMVFDSNNRLVAELSADDGILQTDYSSDFKTLNGIVLPFKSKFVEGTKSIEVKYSSIEVNPTLNEKDWEVPK